MAKKKTETSQAKRQESVKTEAEVEKTKTEVVVEETAKDTEKVTEEPVQKEEPAKQPKTINMIEAVSKDIPSDALRVLKAFNDLEYLYIGKGGGIFRYGTPETVRGKAVLYKNPYFNNN